MSKQPPAHTFVGRTLPYVRIDRNPLIADPLQCSYDVVIPRRFRPVGLQRLSRTELVALHAVISTILTDEAV